MKQYCITREFIGGLLKGLQHSGIYEHSAQVGFVCENPCGGSPYKIIACEEVKSFQIISSK